jgi:hypothetical protein
MNFINLNKLIKLSYLQDLITSFQNLNDKINDYNNFPTGWINTINYANKGNISFYFGTKIELYDTEKYEKFNVSKVFELLVGFYTDTVIEFDLYIDNNFENHYVLEPNKFTPLSNIDGKQYIFASINFIGKNIEIQNINTEWDIIRFITLGVALNNDTREETINSKEIRLFYL